MDAGFDFLGMTVRKYRGTMLIKPSKKGVLSFLESVRKLIKKHPTITTAALIKMLNPHIRGWANYYRRVVSSAVFAYVDHEIWKACCGAGPYDGTPTKVGAGLRRGIFLPSTVWVFTGTEKGADGKKREVHLFFGGLPANPEARPRSRGTQTP